MFKAGEKREKLVYLIKVCLYFNPVYFYEDLFCFKLGTTSHLLIATTCVNNKQETWGPAYAMHGSDGFYLHNSVKLNVE